MHKCQCLFNKYNKSVQKFAKNLADCTKGQVEGRSLTRLASKEPFNVGPRITDTLPIPQGLAKKRYRGGNSHGTRSILFGDAA
jgi:hypothetical protein